MLSEAFRNPAIQKGNQTSANLKTKPPMPSEKGKKKSKQEFLKLTFKGCMVAGKESLFMLLCKEDVPFK